MIIDHSQVDPGDNASDRNDSRGDSLSPIESSLVDEGPDSTVSPTAVDAAFHTPTTPTTLTNPSPIIDSSTRSSTLQTVQSYLNHELLSHLTSILPGLVQGEVRAQCAQLGQVISDQIESLRAEAIRPTGDQDDPMLPSGEDEDSRGRGKRSARSNKGKGKEKETESDNEAEEIRFHLSQQGDEADVEDIDGESENDKETSVGTRKYTKNIFILRVSILSFSPITNTDRSDGRLHFELFSYGKVCW